MQKKFVQAIYIVLMGLSVYSCSEYILPKQVDVKGTLNFPAKVGSVKLGSMLADTMTNIFSVGVENGGKIYNVDYKGQTIQTFCIYFPIEMTEDLNPNDFLKTIDRQINDGIRAEPKEISKEISLAGFYVPTGIDIPISMFKWDDIPPVSLVGIAQYVISIDFDKCDGTSDSGIGINFHFTDIPDGLEMILACKDLNFSSNPKPLVVGDNIFGNEEGLTLCLEDYKSDETKLKFTVTLQSTNPNNRGMLHINSSDLKPGNFLKIKGEMRLFRKWTSAKINLSAAIKSSSIIEDDLKGKFPETDFDLSQMNKYLYGGFTFDDLEVKIYMDGPNPDVINALEAKLIMEAQFNSETRDLYNDVLFISPESIKIDEWLNEEGSYKDSHLPGNTSEHNDNIDGDTTSDIFRTMPADLSFMYRIKIDDGKMLIVYPDTFAEDIDNFSENSKITTIMMIMLPMSLTATGEGENKSTIFLPNVLGNSDLFGRKNTEERLKTGGIDYIRMTVDFANQIFTKGYLFINEDKDLFPEGIKLTGRRTVVYAAEDEFEKIQKKLIFPDIRIELDNGEKIDIPKKAGIVGIKFEMKGLFKLGEL
jgi:hypothetical protein